MKVIIEIKHQPGDVTRSYTIMSVGSHETLHRACLQLLIVKTIPSTLGNVDQKVILSLLILSKISRDRDKKY